MHLRDVKGDHILVDFVRHIAIVDCACYRLEGDVLVEEPCSDVHLASYAAYGKLFGEGGRERLRLCPICWNEFSGVEVVRKGKTVRVYFIHVVNDKEVRHVIKRPI